jgi:hypothetical protein
VAVSLATDIERDLMTDLGNPVSQICHVNSDPSSGDRPEVEAGWWCDLQEVIDFAHVLVDAEELGDCQHAVIDFFEQPSGWDREHRVWCDYGRPDLASGAQFRRVVGLLRADKE